MLGRGWGWGGASEPGAGGGQAPVGGGHDGINGGAVPTPVQYRGPQGSASIEGGPLREVQGRREALQDVLHRLSGRTLLNAPKEAHGQPDIQQVCPSSRGLDCR
jgi:hypothetical protein